MPQNKQFTCVIHAGAGHIKKPKQRAAAWAKNRHAGLKAALTEGQDILSQGGSAVDAVLAAVTTLENDPQFNAGKGGVFAADETISLDASIMDGRTGMAGGVAHVKTVKNPILAAHSVMTVSPHTLLSGPGADDFAKQQGLECVDNAYFRTERRLKTLRKVQKSQKALDDGLGTVGAVAMDQDGNLVAGTSTGGLTNKRPGRISDSAVIGAGTFADNDLCALSGTGHGDVFLRRVTAYRIAAYMEHRKTSLEEAVKYGLEDLKHAGGSGGLIGIDTQGAPVMLFSDRGMYRGYVTNTSPPRTAIFKTDNL